MGTVLITGTSRGIGRATALSLAGAGWTVYAGVRRTEDGDSLAGEAPAGTVTPVLLDLQNADQIASLEQALPADLDAVVNNAGIVVDGPVETLALDDLRRQFEVNVVGQVAVTQALLPRLRESRGRVVFISSLSGRISTPGTGAYNASKFALEGLADALRIELRPWRIKVILVEPTSTDTDMWRTALDQLDRTEAALSDEHRRLYAKHLAGARRMTKMVQKQTVPADQVVAAITRALTDSRPRARYPVGVVSKVQLAMAAATPTSVMDVALAKATGIPRKP